MENSTAENEDQKILELIEDDIEEHVHFVKLLIAQLQEKLSDEPE